LRRRTVGVVKTRFNRNPSAVWHWLEPSPLLGEHATEVFGDWLGISAGHVAGLRDEGIV
jgi:hypothetical protein